MTHLLLSVPETVASHYVIATSEPPDDPHAAVPWRVPKAFRRSAIDALKSPRMGIFTIAAGEHVWRLDDLLACEEDRRRIAESSHQLVVSHHAATVDQPRQEQTARAVARALADATDGVLIDPQARQVVLRDGLAGAERDWFRMGDQWFGTRYSTVGGAACEHDSDGCRCLRITLLGLRRFGLPDLVIDRVARAHDLAALNLLRALACRLLADQWRWLRNRPARPARPVDDHLTIDPADFWAFWAATPSAPGRPVTVRLIAASRAMLRIAPPADYGGAYGAWLNEVLVPSMPPIVGCQADEDSPEAQPAEASRIRF